MIRRIEEKDKKNMMEWMKDTDISKCFKKKFNSYTDKDIDEFIKNSFTNENKHFAFVDEHDNYLGTISLKNIDYDNSKAEVAIVARKCAQGTGEAQKALKELIEYAFNELKLHKLYVNILEENIRSRKFFTKVGFRREGVEEDALKIEEQFHSLYWFGKIKNE